MTEDTKYLSLGFFGRLGYRLAGFFGRLFRPIGRLGRAFARSGPRNRVALAGAVPAMGFGYAVQGRVEKGVLYILLQALYLWYMVAFGGRQLIGRGNLEFLNMQVVAILITLAFVYVYLRVLSNTVLAAERMERGEPVPGSVLARAGRAFGAGAAHFFGNYAAAFRAARPAVRLSMVLPFAVMGAAQIIQKQVVKGLAFLAVEAGFIAYMAIAGVSHLQGLVTLNTQNVVSHFSLLYGILSILIIAAFAGLYCLNLSSALKNAMTINAGRRPPGFKEELRGLSGKKFYIALLIIPIAGALAFTVLPLLFMITIAFTDYGTSGTIPVMNIRWLSWTGLDSFKALFSFGPNLKALVNVFIWTMIWAAFATFTCYFGGILLAVLINKKIVRCKILFRSLFILTMAIPQFVSLRVMYVMFHNYGPVNTLLLEWGWITEGIKFWENTAIAKTLIIFINMWVGIPYFMLLSSGLLINIPTDLYEYARTEGAGKWYVFRKITMPFMLFMTTPLLITNFVSNINNFNVIWLLTGGGPMGQGTGGVAGGTDILITWLYKLTMQNYPEYNLGAAIGIIMFVISAVLSLIVFRNSASYKREEEFS